MELPSGLLEAEEAAEKLAKYKCPITAARLLELAESGHAPCWWWNFDGKRYGPYFRPSELREWVTPWMVQQHGIDFPDKLIVRVIGSPVPWEALPAKELPISLQGMATNIYPVRHETSGVYFLIDDFDTVVYVGQSINVAARVSAHVSDKNFKRAVYLPVPMGNLDDVERAFIQALRPHYNGTHNGVPLDDEDRSRLEKYGYIIQAKSQKPKDTPANV